jgi:hypothetical protein
MIEVIRARLAAYEPQYVNDEPHLPRAAVLLPLYDTGGEPHVVFTKRSELVEHHKGQISFPGGAHDAEDPDLAHTASADVQGIGVAMDRGAAWAARRDDHGVELPRSAVRGTADGGRPVSVLAQRDRGGRDPGGAAGAPAGRATCWRAARSQAASHAYSYTFRHPRHLATARILHRFDLQE